MPAGDDAVYAQIAEGGGQTLAGAHGQKAVPLLCGGDGRLGLHALQLLLDGVQIVGALGFFAGGNGLILGAHVLDFGAFFVGATFGCTVGPLIGLDPSFAAGIGLIALFCGVVNCPLTSLLLGVELFGVQGVLFYAIAVAVSYMLSGYHGLYRGQKIIYSKTEPTFINTTST